MSVWLVIQTTTTLSCAGLTLEAMNQYSVFTLSPVTDSSEEVTVLGNEPAHSQTQAKTLYQLYYQGCLFMTCKWYKGQDKSRYQCLVQGVWMQKAYYQKIPSLSKIINWWLRQCHNQMTQPISGTKRNFLQQHWLTDACASSL